MIKNKNFLGSIETNPYFFHQYDLQNFALYVNGKQIPGGGGQSLGQESREISGNGIQNAF